MHIHRIGRTGREGDAEGLALNLDMDEMGSVGKIEVLQGRESRWFPWPNSRPRAAAPWRRPWSPSRSSAAARRRSVRAMCWEHSPARMGFTREQIGKINVNDFSTYVARWTAPLARRLHSV